MKSYLYLVDFSPIKIVVIGGESTGKSTLCDQLSKSLNCPWVAEFAREYLEEIGRPYQQQDLVEIAKGQLTHEDEACSLASKILICDTDLNVIKVWSEHCYGTCHPFILNQIAWRRYHAYILLTPDLPWVADPLREHPDQIDRNYFFRIYLDIVQNSGLPFKVVEGDGHKRFQKSLHFIESLQKTVY
ncbi:MAG: ATP-binding protein [Chitinophagaceae bacterium]|nr:ATP-binding protein [Chitinophagaceae bacterium]